MELIDTHCHLTFGELADNIDAVIARSRAASVTRWLTVGTNPVENQKAIQLTQRFDNLYAAVAIHPHEAKDVTKNTIAELKKLAQHPRVVAIGETGLDFYYENSPRDRQAAVFSEHLKLAGESHLPLIIHCRKAFHQTIQILDKFAGDVQKVVFHCFSGSPEQAKLVLDRGFYISFTGVVTFKNARKTRQTAQIVPLHRLMLETDSPYMSPQPLRKQKPNEPALLCHTARFLADLRQMPLNDFASATTATARDFFHLPP